MHSRSDLLRYFFGQGPNPCGPVGLKTRVEVPESIRQPALGIRQLEVQVVLLRQLEVQYVITRNTSDKLKQLSLVDPRNKVFDFLFPIFVFRLSALFPTVAYQSTFDIIAHVFLTSVQGFLSG